MTPAERETALRAAVDALVSVLLAAVAPEPADAPDRLLSVDEAAALLGIGRSRTYDEIAAGRLRSLRVGRRRLIPSGAIAAFVAQSSAGGVGDVPPAGGSADRPDASDATPSPSGRRRRRAAA
jgi:excisionase family DNA binding protein